MKIPDIFVPDKNLENTIQTYMKDNKVLHEDPNLKYVMAIISIVPKSRLLSETTSDAIYNLLDETYKKLKYTSKECMHTLDFFKILEETPYTYPLQKENMLSVFLNAQKEYKKRIENHISITMLLEDESVIQNGVMGYVNMIIGLGDEHRQGQSWTYRDPRTGIPKIITIDTNYITRVEEQLGLLTHAQREQFRAEILKVYVTKIQTNPHYDFMDNLKLVEAVTNVQLRSEVAKAGSLIGALASMSNEENKRVYKMVTNNMIKHYGYCKVCAEKTLEHFCTQKN